MSKTVKSVLVIAARFSNNLGDDVIYDVVSDACKKARGIEPIGFSISGNPNYAPNDTKKSPERRLKNFVKGYLKTTAIYYVYVEKKGSRRLKDKLNRLNWDAFDTIVFAGGQLFMDYFVPWIAIIVSYAEKYKKRVVFNCCGMGKLSSSSVNLLRKVIQSESVCDITLRDGLSRFGSLFGNENVIQTMDPAMNSFHVYGTRKKENNEVGLGIISYKMLCRNNIPVTKDEYVAFIKQIIEFLGKKKRKIVVFTNGALDDQEFAQYALKKIGKESLLIKRPVRPDELIDIVASCEQIISFRLHSLILAASYDIPSIGFVWDLKVKEFLETIERGEWAVPLNEGVSFEKVKSRLESLLETNHYRTRYTLPLSYDYLVDFLKE